MIGLLSALLFFPTAVPNTATFSGFLGSFIVMYGGFTTYGDFCDDYDDGFLFRAAQFAAQIYRVIFVYLRLNPVTSQLANTTKKTPNRMIKSLSSGCGGRI